MSIVRKIKIAKINKKEINLSDNDFVSLGILTNLFKNLEVVNDIYYFNNHTKDCIFIYKENIIYFSATYWCLLMKYFPDNKDLKYIVKLTIKMFYNITTSDIEIYEGNMCEIKKPLIKKPKIFSKIFFYFKKLF